MFYSQKLLETDWIFRILKILWHKNAHSRNLCQEGHIGILTLKCHKSFLEFFWNLFCQLEGCVLMAIYVTHHNFAEVYIFEFLPLCAASKSHFGGSLCKPYALFYTLSWKWVHRLNLNHAFFDRFWPMNFKNTHYISFICNIKKLKPFKQLSLVALFLRLFDHSKLYVYPIPKIHFIRVT